MLRNKNVTCIVVTIFSLVFSACTGQNKGNEPSQLILPDTINTIGWEIRDIIQDSHNNMWFASNGDGVYKYDGKTLLQFTEKHGLSSNNVWKLIETKDGEIWCFTNFQNEQKEEIQLCYFDGNGFKKNETNVLDNGQFTKLYKREDEVLNGYFIQGAMAYKFILPKTSPITEGMGLDPRFGYDIYCSTKDQLGNVWFGTHSAGVCMFDGSNYTWLSFPELSVPIRDLYFDKKGMLWILTNGCGAMMYDGNTLVNFTKQQNLTNPNHKAEGYLMRPWSIAEDQTGNVWISTIDAGVWKYDGKTATNYTTKDGLGIDFTWKIFCDHSNTIWVGTVGFGVYTFDGNKFNSFFFK